MFRIKILIMGLILTGWFLSWWSFAVAAQRVYIDITQPNFVRLPVAVPDFLRKGETNPELAAKLARLMTQDLDYSGLFRPLDPRGFLQDAQTMGTTVRDIDFSNWRRLGADFLLRGSYRVNGSQAVVEFRFFDVVAGRRIVGKVFEGNLADIRSMVHRFADEILEALTGQPGVFDTKIAFVEGLKGVKEIEMIDFDGSNPVPVTHDGSVNLSPAWSSDGRRIAYVSYLQGPPKVFVVDLMTGRRRLLSGHRGLNISPAWRPGTDQLAVTLSTRGNPDIFLVSRDGAILRDLVKTWAIDVSPSWSPDGTKLAYVSSETGNPQIYVLDLSSGRKTRITYQGRYNTAPAWSPRGDWIAYTGLAQGRHDIFLVRPDGSQLLQLTHGEGDNESPSWSPDGRQIAFSSTRTGRSAIWITPLTGDRVRRLTNLPGEQELPDWSPRLAR